MSGVWISRRVPKRIRFHKADAEELALSPKVTPSRRHSRRDCSPKGQWEYGASASETLLRVLSDALRRLGNAAASFLGIGFFVRAV